MFPAAGACKHRKSSADGTVGCAVARKEFLYVGSSVLHELESMSYTTATDVQGRGLAHPIDDVKADFKKLLETMAALYRLRTTGGSQELMVDQLADLFADLVAQKVFTKKQLDALDGVRVQLEELKQAAPAVKEAVAAVQEIEGKRIRSELQAFTDGVNAHARAFRKCTFLQFCTGVDESYLAMDEEVRGDLAGVRQLPFATLHVCCARCIQYMELGKYT